MFARFYVGAMWMTSVALLPTSGVNGASIEGHWSGQQGTAVYTQDGNTVRGDATLPNGQTAKIVGVMIGDKVYYSYVRSTGEFGMGTMSVSEDGNHLRSTYKEPSSGREGQWQLDRDAAGGPPAAADGQLAGRWNSNLGETVFEQSGTSATATITFVNGHTGNLAGEIRGNEFEFTFQLDLGGSGRGQLTLSPDRTVLSGKYVKMPGNETGEWILVRPGPVPCAVPDLAPAVKPTDDPP